MISDNELGRMLFGKRSAAERQRSMTTVMGTAVGNSEDGTVSVIIDADAGGVDAALEVPTAGGVADGDSVLVTVDGGVPVDATSAGGTDRIRDEVDGVTNYFWADEEGAHVATVEGDATIGPNVLIDSDGMDVRDGTDVLAHFGETAVVGREDTSHVEIGASSTAFYGAAGAKVGSIDSGANTVIPASFGYLYQSVEPGGSLTKKVEPEPSFALEPVTIGVDRIERQSGTLVPVILWSQSFTFAGYGTQTLQDGTLLTLAANPTRQGQATVTFERTDTSTDTFLYEIFFTYKSVIPKPSYLFGTTSDAVEAGAFSFAAGQSVAAGGYGSAAFGEYTTAAGDSQAVFGRNNLVDSDGEYAVIVGNGFVDTDHLHRGEPGSNALTLDWDGNLEVAGRLSTQAADLMFGVPAYNSVFRRLAFTSIGNLRFDTSSDGETWAADSYFVKAPASLGTGAANDYVVQVGSNDDATGIHWRWMKYASGYAIAWGYFTGSWSATTAWGALYYKETTRLPNPFTWAAAPYEWMQPRGTSYFWCINHNDATASQTGTYYLMSPTSQSTARAATLDFLQIGRWE